MANDTIDDNSPSRPAPAEGRSGSLMWVGVAVAALLIGGLFVFSGLSGSSDGGDGTAAPAGSDGDVAASGIHSIPFTTETGETDTLAAYSGEPLVVNFFAAWCPPCRAELPDFQAVHEARGEDVTFVGVSHDFDEAQWKALLGETGVTFDTVFQPGQEIWTEAGGIGMPTTIFISPEGEIVETHSGILTAEQLTNLIDEHLA